LAAVETEPELGTAGHDDPGEPPPSAPTPDSRSPYWLPLGVLILALAITATLALVSQSQYNSNEKRLLALRVHDAGELFTTAVPTTQSALASVAELADATGGDVKRIKPFIAGYGGVKPKREFASVSVWDLDHLQAGPIAVAGLAPSLTTAEAPAFFAQVAAKPVLNVISRLRSPMPRIGYGYAVAGPGNHFAVYAETVLPASRRSKYQSNSAFVGLNYALYLGRSVSPQNLLVSDVKKLTGSQSKDVIPFGNSELTLVMDARQPLAGSLPKNLPVIVGIVGVLLALGGAALTLRLVQRRRDAEHLAGRLERVAGENERLYAEQRTIAQTLQHALLPEELPQLRGAEASARYEAGTPGVDIGGDWYDVIPLDDHRMLIVVGDVSGRGLRAATTMASLRYAIHAYAAQDDSPTTILAKLSSLLNIAVSGQLATVLCAVVDVDAHTLTVTSAGHLPPLLLSNGHGKYIESEIGVPIGVQEHASYVSTTVSVPPKATFIAFTDGLVERRGENLDEGLARLRKAAIGNHSELPELLGTLLHELLTGTIEDDTAIVGFRWKD
jgi:serine phosphatase RsbU (regulator of sigma subunit)